MGMGGDEVIEDRVAAMARSSSPDERHFAARQMANIALTSEDLKAVARALKALRSFLPLDPGLENALDKRMLSLIDAGHVSKSAALAEAIALFMLRRAKERASAARPYIPALMSFLPQKMETTGASSYYTLMIVASDAPACFEPHADTLVRMLDSPDNATKVFVMRIIAGLAATHPEYVVSARDLLRNMAENSTQELVKAEAAKAYCAVRDVPVTQRGYGSHLLDDPAAASICEKPVWQRAVGCHLSAAYGSDLRTDDRKQGRYQGIKKAGRLSKRSNLYQEFVEKLKQDEPTQPAEEPIIVCPPEAAAEAVPEEKTQFETAISPPLPVAEVVQPAVDELTVTTSPAAEGLPDLSGAVDLQEMMNEVQVDFSSMAGGLLDALGMGHMKLGSTVKAEDGNRKISGKELVSALEKLVREQKTKVL
jgi:hypothetical protein